MKRGEGNRERERGGGREGEREDVNIVKLHGHAYTDNLTCMLLVWLWRRMKELVPVQQTSQ